MSQNSKPFTSRFTLMESRKTGAIGVLREVPRPSGEDRDFYIIWEDGTVRNSYDPKDLLTLMVPYNTKAKKLMLELMTGPWLVPAEAGGEEEV